jgi:hypothetical protein
VLLKPKFNPSKGDISNRYNALSRIIIVTAIAALVIMWLCKSRIVSPWVIVSVAVILLVVVVVCYKNCMATEYSLPQTENFGTEDFKQTEDFSPLERFSAPDALLGMPVNTPNTVGNYSSHSCSTINGVGYNCGKTCNNSQGKSGPIGGVTELPRPYKAAVEEMDAEHSHWALPLVATNGGCDNCSTGGTQIGGMNYNVPNYNELFAGNEETIKGYNWRDYQKNLREKTLDEAFTWNLALNSQTLLAENQFRSDMVRDRLIRIQRDNPRSKGVAMFKK